jgi:histidinol phosphatase-like enzyme (inositol monophosphatase family)
VSADADQAHPGPDPDAPPVDPDLLSFAVELVRGAGEVTLRWFADDELQVDQKSDGTPVTDADRAAEHWVRLQLAEHCPHDTVIGEEELPSEGTSGRRWILDPIDGTKAFTRGVPLYSTLLAFDDEHGPAVGVIGLPALGQIVWAGRGRGCWFDGRPAHVSDTASVDGAYLTTSSFSHWPESDLLAVKRAGAMLRTWGDGYGYSLVATGRADVMVDHEVALYDVAAFPVIFAEAGGSFTSLDGDPSPGAGSGLATNGVLHEQLMKLLTADRG